MIGTLIRRSRRLATTTVGPIVARRQPVRVDLSPEHWGLSIGPNGTLWCGEVDLARLAHERGTPLHVARADAIDRNATEALAASAGSECLDVFYSYKTNPVPGVLTRLHAAGVGAEVISPYELWLAQRLGVPAERIVYNGPAKSTESLRTAIESGVHLVNANSVSEAARIAEVAAEVRRPVRLGLRVALPGGWAGQFGIGAWSPKLVEAVRHALAAPFVELRALHAHRGLLIRTEEELGGHVGALLAVCDELRRQTGWHPEILDIGGSLACPTSAPIPHTQFRLNRALGSDLLPPPGGAITVRAAGDAAVRQVREHFRSSNLDAPRLILEPGRAMTGDTQFLLATVLDVKDDGELGHVVLDAGINVAEPVPHEFHQLFSVTAPTAPATTSYRLVGPICTPADVLYNNWRLPPPRPGDVVAIMDSGAYFVPFSTAFSFPRAGVVMVDGATLTDCRRAESFDDMVALDHLGQGR